ncbi:MAG: hypothetical protein SGBAC_010220 [Bacillariaceae sp.]
MSIHNSPKQEDIVPVTERKVCFNDRVRCRRSKTTQTNLESSWYSKDEITHFRKRDKHIRSLFASGTFTSAKTYFVGEKETEEVSFVGLLSQEESKQRIKCVKEAKSCILGEQMQQEEDFYKNENGIAQSFELDQESIADFYSIYSKRATEAAHMKGLQVSWHVENMWDEESTYIDASQRSCSHSAPNLLQIIAHDETLRTDPLVAYLHA